MKKIIAFFCMTVLFPDFVFLEMSVDQKAAMQRNNKRFRLDFSKVCVSLPQSKRRILLKALEKPTLLMLNLIASKIFEKSIFQNMAAYCFNVIL